MYEGFERLKYEEVLDILDKLIQESRTALEIAERELRNVRTTLASLVVKEEALGLGSLSEEEEQEREKASSGFKELWNKVELNKEKLEKLRAVRKEWEERGLPSSIPNKFEDLLFRR